MGIARKLSRNPTLQHFQHTYNKTVGHKLRDFISTLAIRLDPVIKYVFPNFIVVHYYYIISLTIICSLLIYPVKNVAYIDLLFLSTGATTQGGLNTVDLNELTLYQQVVLYITCIISTPIWIHGGLVFIRLFWFERYFDGIREWSKKYYHMRRTKTLIAREMSRTMSSGAAGRQRAGKDTQNGNSRNFTKTSTGITDFQAMLFSGTLLKRENTVGVTDDKEAVQHKIEQESPSKNIEESTANGERISPNAVDESSTQSSRWNDKRAALHSTSNRSLDSKAQDQSASFQGRRQQREIDPADMYRSIAMMQNQHYETDEDRGPALVIKGPHEQERDDDDDDVDDDDEEAEELDSSAGLRKNRSRKRKSVSPRSPRRSKHSSGADLGGQNNALSIQFDINNMPKPSARKLNHMNSDIGSRSVDINTVSGRRRRSLFRRLSSASTLKDRFLRGSLPCSSHDEEEEDGNDADLEDSEEDVEDTNSSTDISSMRTVTSGDTQKETTSSKLANARPQGRFGIRHSTSNRLKKLRQSSSFGRVFGERPFSGSNKGNKPSQDAATPVSHPDLMNSVDSFSNYYDEESGYMGLDLTQQPTLNKLSTNYLSYEPNIGRNSAFVGLTDNQKTELGGVEYRATKLLCKLLGVYYFGFHLSAVILLLPWIHANPKYKNIVKDSGISPTWWAFFTSMSSFNDLGLTLTPDSMNSFKSTVYPLLIMSWLIIIGNTGFPILLRFIIWVMFKFAPDLSLMKENLGFLLDHPRRCFTLLFPSAATWWLFLILVALNVFDLALFIILDLRARVLDGLHTGSRILDGFFQAVSTRTAGFSVLDVSQLHPSIQVSYMLMMYVSVMPVAISIRRTNVYEEQSLGIYGDMIPVPAGHRHDSASTKEDTQNDKNKEENDTDLPNDQDTRSFISAHLRKQLSFDLWYMFLGLFIICIAEGDNIQDPSKPAFTVFQVLFEVVSAYGTVGLSLGYPETNQSLSGQFNTVSKLVIIAMLIRGRHRGLPYSLDRAIMLSSKKLKHIDELEDLKLQRTMTNNKDPLLQYWKRRTRPVSSGIANVINRTKLRRWSQNTQNTSGIEMSDLRPQRQADGLKSDYTMEQPDAFSGRDSLELPRSNSTISPCSVQSGLEFEGTHDVDHSGSNTLSLDTKGDTSPAT